MAETSEPLTGTPSEGASIVEVTRPRVVVIVSPAGAHPANGEAARSPAPALDDLVDPVSEAQMDPVIGASGEPSGDPPADLGDRLGEQGDVTPPPAGVAARRARATDWAADQPTERLSREREKRGPEDDRLAAVVIQIDLDADPSPLADFLGRSLLFRAGRAAAQAGAPRLILVSRHAIEGDERAALAGQEASAGFRGEVELTAEDPLSADIGRGRVLVLDGSALHDGASLRRLAQVRGEKTSLLLGRHGDGLRVRTDEGQIVELGPEVPSNDGVLVGACSVPAEELERVTRLGQRAVFDRLGREQLLFGTVATETYGRQFGDGRRARNAEQTCYERLSSSGQDGLFDDLIGRPLSRLVTLSVLRRPWVTPTLISAVAGLIGLVGAVLLGLGRPDMVLAAALVLVVSAVLDRTDGELARLRLLDDRRRLDFSLDHVTHVLVLMGLAWGIQLDPAGWERALKLLPQDVTAALGPVSPLVVGGVASLGVVLLFGVLLWRGVPDPQARGLRRFGDFLATSFGSRDYFYLLVIAAGVHMASPHTGVMGAFLLLSAVLIHAFWLAVFAVTLVAGRNR